MPGDVASKILELCRQHASEDLLVVTVYDADGIHHEYIVEEVEEQSDQIAMDALQRPVQTIHRTLELISKLNKLGGEHEGSIHFYEYVTFLHFPLGDQSGIIVSLDPHSDRHTEIYTACRALIKDEVGAS